MKSLWKKVGLGLGGLALLAAVTAGGIYLRTGSKGDALGNSKDSAVVMKEVPCAKDYGGGRCGVVTAPLDYQGREPENIEVGFIYYPATNPFADLSRVLQLVSGGPGLSMSGFLDGFLARSIRLRFNDTAILAIDPRGVGRSTRLMCPKTENQANQFSALNPDFVNKCAVEAGPSRVHYNTENTVRDFERVKRALGIGKIDLLGFSYGTNASIVYAENFPNEIRSIILDGPYAMADKELFLNDFHAAFIRQIVAACETSKKCTKVEGLAALEYVTTELRAAPRKVALPKRSYKLPEHATLDNKLLATMTRFMPGSLADKHYFTILGALLDAKKGNWKRLDELAKVWTLFGLDPTLVSEDIDKGAITSEALGRAVDCSEVDFYWDPSVDPKLRKIQAEKALDASDVRGDVRPFKVREWLGQDLRGGCLNYPSHAKGYESPKRYAKINQFPQHVPVLMMIGDLDMNTPLESAAALAKTLNNKFFARFQYNEHLTIINNNCGAGMAVNFLNTLKVENPSKCLTSGDVPLDIYNLSPLIKDYLAGKPII
jgi:pimeloyl-ACP methyl ester carboxylesterase